MRYRFIGLFSSNCRPMSVMRSSDMGWLAELILQGFWEGAVEVAYRKWGWLGGGVAFLFPPILIVLMIWVLVR